MKKMNLRLILLLLVLSPLAYGQENRHALLIAGLGGEEIYTEAHQTYLREVRNALIDRFGFPNEQVTVLAERKLQDLDFVDGVSTAEEIRARFATLSQTVAPEDHVYVILFGHGSFDGTNAALNIPRRDLKDVDYAELVDGLNAGLVVFVNTASASGPFIPVLSGLDRIVITATRTGTQRNITRFPEFLVEALTTPESDLDKNGDLSLREVFAYAAAETQQAYEADRNLATEFALLDDTGDGQGVRVEELEASGEGNVAAATFLFRSLEATAMSGANRDEVAPLLQNKQQIERDIAAVKSQKTQLPEDAYYSELEVLFVRLATLNAQIEELTGSD